jgi:SAM-dependent methyltransferase
MVSGSLSFDGLVDLYDETRCFDEACFDAALDYIEERFPPCEYPNVFEPGIGTGRIALPFAERGYRVTGVDISDEMLAFLQGRLGGLARPDAIAFLKADVVDLPFADGSFDTAIVVHLFYWVSEWRRAARELLRVVRSGGPVVLMHTGMGAEVPDLNRRYRELCTVGGYSPQTYGVIGTSDVVDYYSGVGGSAEWIKDRWRWTTRIRLGTALDYIRKRAYSFTARTPDGVHAKAVRSLEQELMQQHGGLDVEVEIPNQIYLVIVRR